MGMTAGNLEPKRSGDSGYGSKVTTPRDSLQLRDQDYEDQIWNDNNSNEDVSVASREETHAPPKPPVNAIKKTRFSHDSKYAEDDNNSIFHSVEPAVPTREKLRFLSWCCSVAANQGWKEVKSLNRKTPSPLDAPFTRDLFDRYIMLPMANKEPRLLASGPGEHIELYHLSDVDAYRTGKLESLQGRPTQRLINLASNNYGGFAQLENEPGAARLQELALQALPLTPAPAALEDAVRDEFIQFMGASFDACELSSSGFNSNMLAFTVVAETAAAQGRPCIFLCDRDSHSSMWTGAYSNQAKNAKTLKFVHNSVADLEAQLRECRRRWPDALVCVAIEGTYSMEGTVPPLPAMLALKKQYGFKLLVDEAHSFLGLGSGGRGAFEYWQDQGFDCPLTEADLLTCTFSKSVGCLGAAVLANGEFAQHLRPGVDMVSGPCGRGLATLVLVRVLQLLRKHRLIQHRMAMLREKSMYVAKRLASAGCKILGSPGSPNICFPVGTMHRLSSCIKDSIDNGVALSCGVPPATSLWCCRVRASVFATMSWDDIDQALVETARIAVEHGVPGMRKIEADRNLVAVKKARQLVTDQQASALEEEARLVDSGIESFIESLADNGSEGGASGLGRHQAVIDAGTTALQRYGIGPCSARHYYGCFDTYLALEKKLATLYPCLTKQAGKCEALVCGDAQISIGAAVAARAQVPRQKDAYTLVLVPESAPGYVTSILNAIKDDPRCTIAMYKSPQDIFRLVHDESRRQKPKGYKKCYLTLYLRSGLDNDDLDLPRLLRGAAVLKNQKKLLVGMTVLVDDTMGLGKMGPRKLGYLDHLESAQGTSVLADAAGRGSSQAMQIVVIGSFYRAFGHTGAYMIGSKATMEALNFQNRGFLFSAPPLPLQTAMTSKAIDMMLDDTTGSGAEQL